MEASRAKEASGEVSGMIARHTLNTIAGGFAGGREISSTRKRYVCQVLNIEDLLQVRDTKAPEAVIVFSEEDVFGLHTHKYVPMVIIVKYEE